ncbi:Ldh family oxidoreductase [Rhodocista pekingensis]|uniref:Ldh family oxidoreductase n=1 Tax=Rhodocista pekingensis TaxID=201185 RepID=A0ABW2KZ44_9PROT
MMSGPIRMTLQEAEGLAMDALVACRTSPDAARATARALVQAEADGQKGHGLSRVPCYAAQSRNGKVDGFARPSVRKLAPSVLRVDAAHGFAYPALDLAVAEIEPLAHSQGIALATIHRSHHFGQAGAVVERLADRGLVGLLLGNAPKAMAFWGGRQPMIGTNPVAIAAPVPVGPPLVIDMALSQVARGKVMAAQQLGEPIPEGWALDRDGNPTTDAAAALKGSMLPIGGAKGAALALMVEVLSAALTASHFGWEASSLLDDVGPPPGLGQTLVAIDPAPSSDGRFLSRMGELIAAFAREPGVRPPGSRRLENRARAAREGIALPPTLHAEILSLLEAAA